MLTLSIVCILICPALFTLKVEKPSTTILKTNHHEILEVGGGLSTSSYSKGTCSEGDLLSSSVPL